jgi:hypothetical protein
MFLINVINLKNKWENSTLSELLQIAIQRRILVSLNIVFISFELGKKVLLMLQTMLRTVIFYTEGPHRTHIRKSIFIVLIVIVFQNP